MQVEFAVVREAAEEFLDAFDVEVADFVRSILGLIDAGASAGEVYSNVGQGVFHGDGAVTVAGDALLLSERFEQSLAEAYAEVFDGMVRVDVQVAFRFRGQVDFAVLAEVGKHVVEEADAGVDVVFSEAVEVNFYLYIGFLRFAFNVCRSFFHHTILIQFL